MQFQNKISTLIFDFGGVIYDIDIDNGIKNLKRIGFTDADYYIGHFAHKDFFVQWETGEISPDEFRKAIRKHSNQVLTNNQIDNAWCSIMLSIPDERIELLKKLRRRYQLLLLSNTNPLHIETSTRQELGKRGLTMEDLFDKCYYSYQLGAVKPHPEIFEKLISDANIQPDSCLFLDDGKQNIDTAKRMGFNTYHVTPGQNLDFLLENITFAK